MHWHSACSPFLGNGVAFAQTDQLSNSPGVPAKRPWVVTPRERIVVEQGAFVLFDAPRGANAAGLAGDYLAYWNDFASADIYVFTRLIVAREDVLDSLRWLRREFGVDPRAIAPEAFGVRGSDRSPAGKARKAGARPDPPVSPLDEGGGNARLEPPESPLDEAEGGAEFDAAASAPDAERGGVENRRMWVSANQRIVMEISGLWATSDDEEWIEDPVVVATPIPPCNPCARPSPGGERGASGVPDDGEVPLGEFDDPYAAAVAAACACCGVTCPYCNDNNQCTNEYCRITCGYAFCVYPPRYCNDGNKCTTDSCSPSSGCQFTPKVCPDDGNVCTIDLGCDALTGECQYPPACGPANCCPANGGYLCCGGDTPQCCVTEGVPSWDHCCPAGTNCCGASCCTAGQSCCASNVCCLQPCNECIDHGTLLGGTVFAEPWVVCVGNTITFMADGVVDSGGSKRVECAEVSIPPTVPTYTWFIQKPDGVIEEGEGSVASIVADLPGYYWCWFMATANRECEPGPHVLDPIDALAIYAEMNPITSGTDPIPYNPAIVAPMTPLWIGDGLLWWQANSFELTLLEPPDVELASLPKDITWAFVVTGGSITPQARVVMRGDLSGAILEIPFPSWGNLGSGRMEFRVAGSPCAAAPTLIKNVQPDLEPGDFRFQVKAHLCTDGAGTSTSRSAAEVRGIMADVTKVLSQCGIYITLSEVVIETVSLELVDDLSIELGPLYTGELFDLFDYNEDEVAIDVYFVRQLDDDETDGATITPEQSDFREAGVAIADHTADGPLQGQEFVRVLAHELMHYLLNHQNPQADHRTAPKNLMYETALSTSRDLDENQCLEVRSNHGVD